MDLAHSVGFSINFSVESSGDFFDTFVKFRNFVTLESTREVRAQLRGLQLSARDHDKELQRAARDLVRDCDAHAIFNAVIFERSGLDLSGRDFQASDIDNVIAAACNVHEAIFVDVAEVVGVDDAVDEGSGGEFGVVDVAFHVHVAGAGNEAGVFF